MQNLRILLLLGAGVALSASPGFSQLNRDAVSSADFSKTEGTIVSINESTLVLRDSDGGYQLFAFDRDASRPANLKEGARVIVDSRPFERNVRMVRTVSLWNGEPAAQNRSRTDRDDLTQAGRNQNRQSDGRQSARDNRDSPGAVAAEQEEPAAGNSAQSTGGAASAGDDPVPPEVRRLERQIERQARRFRAGVHAGAGFDPEILMGGVHAQMGPFFSPNVTFRPGLDFGVGEVSTYAAINLEALYRLPMTARGGRWHAYVGGGPGLNFLDQNFERAEAGEREIDFDDFDFDASLNLLAGVEYRSGMFIELKSAAWGRPHTRIMFGVHF